MTPRDWKKDVPVAQKRWEEKLTALPDGLRTYLQRSDPGNIHRNANDKDLLMGTWSDADLLFRYLLAQLDPGALPKNEDEERDIARLTELLEGKP